MSAPAASGRARLAPCLRYLGLLAHAPALLALAHVGVAWLADERFALLPFAATAGLALALGQALYWSTRHADDASLHETMIVAALGWLLVPLLGALPLYALAVASGSGAHPELAVFAAPANAIFEGFSGFTSTGLSVVAEASRLPATVQLWRSSMQWVGGVGVIVLMLAVLRPQQGAYRLYRAEARDEKIGPTVRSTVRSMSWIYAAVTAAGVLALRAAGAPWWEALNHGLTAVSTGGFTVTDASAAELPPAVQGVLMVLVLTGAVSFAAHHRLFQRRPVPPWRDEQHRALFLLLLAGVAVVALERWLHGGDADWLASAFQATSAITTAGFQSADLGAWGDAAKLLLCVGMLLGGAAGSTAGGIKQARVVLLVKGLFWHFRSVALGRHEVMRYELDGEGVAPEEATRAVQDAGILVSCWFASLGVAVLLLLHLAPSGATLGDVILEATSAQGNVGLSTGLTSAALGAPAKAVLVALMWAGRLEILPVLLLLTPAPRRARHRVRRGRHRSPPPDTSTIER